MRRVLFITFHFPPSVEVGAYSCAQIARYLPLHRWEPIVLTATPRHYQFLDRRVEPTAQVIRTSAIPHPLVVYRSVKSRFVRQKPDPSGTDDRLGSPGPRPRIGHSLGALLSIPDLYVGWLAPAVLSGLRAVRKFEICHLLSSGPCWTNHLVGLILAQATHLPWTAHFRDPWAGATNGNPIANIHRRIEAALERVVVARARSVVCVTSHHSRLLQRRYSHLPARKFVTIPNGFDEAEWEGVEGNCGEWEDENGESGQQNATAPGKFVITYAGWLYQDRTPEPVFRALRYLIDHGEVDIARLQIDLIGWCDMASGQSVKAIAARWGLNQCLRMDGPLTKTETFRRIARSSLLLLLAEGWTLQVPAKAYEYLRASRPILALAPQEGAVADLFSRTGGAWVVDHTNDTGITAAVREAYLTWSHGRPPRTPDPKVVAEFDRARLANRFAHIFDTAGPAVEHRP